MFVFLYSWLLARIGLLISCEKVQTLLNLGISTVSGSNSGSEHILLSTIPLQNDDDWVSVEEEKKDYSGLKIGTLKIEDKDKAEPEEEHEINDEGERVPVKKTGDIWAQKRNEQNASPGTEIPTLDQG